MSRHFNDFITAYLEYTDDWNEASELFRAWGAVSAIAAVLERKVYIRWANTLYPNMYIMIVAPAGERKGTGISPALDLLREVGVNLAANTTTRAGLIRDLKKCLMNCVPPEDMPLSSHASLTIFSKEVTVFMNHSNKQLIDDLCDLYDCDSYWRYGTKTEDLDDAIDNVWLNMIGATTPANLANAIPMEASSGGLLSRFVTVYDDNTRIIPFPDRTDKHDRLHDLLREDLLQIKALNGGYTMSQDYKDLYKPFYEQTRSGNMFQGSLLEHYPARRPTHLIKLSIIMCASRNGGRILMPEDFERALGMLKAAEANMMEPFKGIGKADNADVRERIMKYIGVRKKVSYKELLTAFYQDLNPGDLDALIIMLEEMKFCKIQIHRETLDKYIVYISQ